MVKIHFIAQPIKECVAMDKIIRDENEPEKPEGALNAKAEKGRKGEELAAQLLQAKHFDIVQRNYRHKRGEIDIIARKGKLLIFVEVKARSGNRFGYPETFVSEKKAALIVNTAEHFIYEQNWQHQIRFDIIAVEGRNSKVLHFEDAFYR